MNFDSYVSILNSDLRTLKGVGEKKSTLFSKLGVNTISDLIYFFPRTYEDRTVFYSIYDAPNDSYCCIKARPVRNVIEKKIKKNISLYILKAEDYSGQITVKWFSSPFNKTKVELGNEYTFYGKIISENGSKEMEMKTMEPSDKNVLTGCIVPVYASTSGLSQNDIRKAVLNSFSLIQNILETMPCGILNSNSLVDKDTALKNMHNPINMQIYNLARCRLAYEEVFVLTLALLKMRTSLKTYTSVKPQDIKCVLNFTGTLSYELTADQKKAINEICHDFISGVPMNRLLQGDVGSGKTVVAAASAYIMAKNGYQSVIMAPTEILANQHYETFSSFFKNLGINIALLTGSVKNKKEISEQISSGKIDIIVGTHALLEDYIKFSNLGLCITDEQHRFGVKQRSKLSHGEKYPHVLVMSATPIPRTLSLIVYGDLDVSVISTLPSGRKEIDTFCVNSTLKPRIYEFMNKNIREGRQCFVVCPLVEESEKIEASSSVEVYKELSRVFGENQVSLVHGKMSSAEKDSVMQSFRDGKTSVLVSTTVIEVGIDIPNSNIIVIENADRFGLSQLHQLRGRVGRGNAKSYCILITDNNSEECLQRMKIMCTTKDGFELSKKDLELRGCGEFFGTRQHGLPELKIANLFTDIELIKKVREDCEKIISKDPELSDKELEFIKSRIDTLFAKHGGLEIFN